MAKRTIHQLIDDLDGSEATETVSFGVNGAAFQIDLSAINARRFREALAPYVEKATRVRGEGKSRTARTFYEAVNDFEQRRARNGAIRAWFNALDEASQARIYRVGTLPERGQVAGAVVAAYNSRDAAQVQRRADSDAGGKVQPAPVAAFKAPEAPGASTEAVVKAPATKPTRTAAKRATTVPAVDKTPARKRSPKAG